MTGCATMLLGGKDGILPRVRLLSSNGIHATNGEPRPLGGTAVITTKEFSEAMSRYRKRVLWMAAVSVIALFGCFAIVLPFRDAVHGFYVAKFGDAAAELLLGMTPFPAVPVTFVGIWLVERQSKRDGHLHCPNCRKCLVGLQYLVIATRNCGYCGKPVLHESAGGLNK